MIKVWKETNKVTTQKIYLQNAGGKPELKIIHIWLKKEINQNIIQINQEEVRNKYGKNIKYSTTTL